MSIPIVYQRSSSLGQFKYCQMSWFIGYILGHTAPSNAKADLGSTVHAVFEILAIAKKYIQDNKVRKNGSFKIVQEPIGEITIKMSEFYTNDFIDKLIDKCLKFYIKHNPHNDFDYDKDYKFCKKGVYDTLAFNKGEFDPRYCNILQPEQGFDMPLEFDWAKYQYEENGETKEDYLRIKGTIDLTTIVDDKSIQIVDYKGLCVETPIPTTSGWKKMGELEVGDEVFDIHGFPTKVIGKSLVKEKQCYSVKFDCGESVICDDEHLWLLSDGRVVEIAELRVGDTISVAAPLKLPLYGADGMEYYNQAAKLAEDNNYDIPQEYFRGNVDQRRTLLEYILFFCSVTHTYTRGEYVCRLANKKIADYVIELVSSSGGKSRTECENNSISIVFSFNKDQTLKITSIQNLIKTRQTQCISVDSPTQTYLCSKSMIPTHNTGQRKDWAKDGNAKKEYPDLMDDIQLLLYNYAIYKLYPQYDNVFTTIFFCRDGGPYYLVFDEIDRAKFLDRLKNIHNEMQNSVPKPRSYSRGDFRCTKLCKYLKDEWKDSGMSMCHYIEKHLKEHGVEKTMKDCTKEGFNIAKYVDPGSVDR